MKVLKLITMFMFMTLTSGCAIFHYYGPFYGKLIDRETKRPLEDAVVLVAYYTEMYTPAGAVGSYLNAREVVTDVNGEFTVPSYYAITFRPISGFEEKPYFTIFRPGYTCYPDYGFRARFLGAMPEDHFVIIELLELKGGEVRNSSCSPPPSVPEHKMIKLRELENKERMGLGFKPLINKH